MGKDSQISCFCGDVLTFLQNKAKWDNFDRWGNSEHTILSWNHNTGQVNKELHCIALRLDLRVHYIFDLGCKSSAYSFQTLMSKLPCLKNCVEIAPLYPTKEDLVCSFPAC